MADRQQIRGLITRLARIDAGEGWADDLNPAQRAALDYLGQANRFSRSPSHVAEYLGTTRGTMSQTLKVLVRKGYVTELRSEADKRTISYALTQAGRNAILGSGLLARVAGGSAGKPPRRAATGPARHAARSPGRERQPGLRDLPGLPPFHGARGGRILRADAACAGAT